MRKNILDFTLLELEKQLLELREKRFRATQIFKQLHDKNIFNFDDFRNLPKELILKLKDKYLIETLNLIDLKESPIDNTKKFLFELPGSKDKIETVLIIEKERKTICVSTQAGCNAGCEFCATGKIGFKKNLSPSEIVSQIYLVTAQIGEKPTNIVFMGMGEPFLNYEKVITSLKILTDENGLGISSRRITVSTIGFKGKIKKLSDDLCVNENKRIKNIKLALSLHSTDNGLREKLIPISKINPLSKIYEELNYFYKKTKNKITFEYIFFEGLNDTENDVKRLSRITKMFPCNINVIPFHPIDFHLNEPLEKFNGKEFSLSKNKLFDFIDRLKKNGVIVNLRNSSGVDIYAACGQLAGKSLQRQK
ncbi:MAG: 23S rRNA (adenine(2503)-C(2))-methyltransferase RlmN [Ignavibacteriae bacterium]|nr:23S rRNA (adenine(2503)-C(2))-methyltransferase RlmN [Ignavibacteriota bacterium]